MRVTFTPAAERDLDDIWFAIAQDSWSSADRIIDRIKERLAQLSEFPESGPVRPDIDREGARGLTVGNYLILYKIVDEIVVVRVVHGARDLAALL